MKQVGFSTAQEGDLYTDLESAKKKCCAGNVRGILEALYYIWANFDRS